MSFFLFRLELSISQLDSWMAPFIENCSLNKKQDPENSFIVCYIANFFQL